MTFVEMLGLLAWAYVFIGFAVFMGYSVANRWTSSRKALAIGIAWLFGAGLVLGDWIARYHERLDSEEADGGRNAK